jgi:hypothetical protein
MTVSFKKIIIGTMIASMALSAGAALAQDNYSTNTNAPTPMLTSTRQPAVKKTIDLPCVAAAVAKREAAVSSAFSTKSTAISAAFTQRASDLAAAWAITVAKDRNAAIKAAWKTFNASAKTARTAYLTANKAAWKTFASDAKVCRAPSATDAGAATGDASL